MNDEGEHSTWHQPIVEEVRLVKYEVHTPTCIETYRDFGSYEEAHAYLDTLGASLPRSIWRCWCYDDGNDTRYTRQLLVAFKG